MNLSRRARRMERQHRRSGGRVGINLVSLMDIFTILVFFLLVNSSDGETLPTLKSVELPESVSEETPRRTVVVTVSPDAVRVQGEIVATLDELRQADGDTQSALLRALRQANPASGTGDAATREATIMGDRSIEFRILKQVMAGCTAAGFSRISLAVLQKPLES
jgi:biopolymer transport protein ExbD